MARFELYHILHTAFSPSPFAENHGPVLILEAGRNNFAGAGAVSIDEYHDRYIAEFPAFGRVPNTLVRVAAIGADNAAAVDEQIAHSHSGGQQSAWIKSQIEHQTPGFLLL